MNKQFKKFRTVDITLDIHIIKIEKKDILVTNNVYIRGTFYNLYYNKDKHEIYAVKSYS